VVEFLIFTVGCFLGGLVTYIVIRRKNVGTLRFYKIDPSEPPAMTAILDKTPDEIGRRQFAVFQVSHE
jgi:hypothetical protein